MGSSSPNRDENQKMCALPPPRLFFFWGGGLKPCPAWYHNWVDSSLGVPPRTTTFIKRSGSLWNLILEDTQGILEDGPTKNPPISWGFEFCFFVGNVHSLKLTAKATENRPFNAPRRKRVRSYSNPCFSGAKWLLVSGGVFFLRIHVFVAWKHGKTIHEFLWKVVCAFSFQASKAELSRKHAEGRQVCTTVDGTQKSGDHQLRLVVYPII